MLVHSFYKRLAVIAWTLVSCSISLGQPNVQEISIYCKHRGWVSKESSYTIKRTADGLKADGQEVAEDRIDNLVKAVSGPVIPELDFANLGITPQWVEANAPIIVDNIISHPWRGPLSNCSGLQKEFFRREAHKPSTIEKVIKAHYGPVWTDDHPEISVDISLDSGRSIQLHSRSQKQFMIPWLLSRDWYSSAPYKTATYNTPTYNANISRAVAALMPEGFLHRARLKGDLVNVLSDNLWMHLAPEISTMMLSETLGSAYSDFTKQYEIRSSYLHARWNAKVRRKEGPQQVQFELRLPFNRGVVPDLKRFVEQADGLAERVLAVPWLRDYFDEHPNTTVYIQFRDAATADHSELEYFSKRVTRPNKEKLVRLLESQQRDRILIEVREEDGRSSNWWVLPDKRMVLSYFAGDGALAWRAGQLGYTPSKMEMRYVGALVSPEGMLLPLNW